ncbi:MAG: TerC family protein [Candidatus Omnitrophota bacterium]|jgi:tellurite resistance protein TerC
MTPVLAWIIFSAVILVMLALDLGVFHRGSHAVGMKEALIWSAVWIVVALLFNLGIYWVRGADLAFQFLSAYILERSLSFDNLFVFLLIFNYFRVPRKYHHSILFWGILGALVMRAIFIASGIALIHMFHWMLYVFGVILLLTGFKLLFEKDKQIEPEKNLLIKVFRRFMPVSEGDEGGKFFLRKSGRLFATPLMVVLLVIETTDVIFAVDSIPAVLAISTDPFIVYTSNVLAILGLRALYFALEGLMQLFHHLHYGLSVILILIGVKMLLIDLVKVPTVAALLAICVILALSVVASVIWPKPAGSTPSHG